MSTTRSGINVNSPLAYIYDDLYRLTEATRPLPSQPVETFTYDPVGNRLLRDGQTTNAVFDDANRLLEDQDFTYSYDNNGNLIQKTNKATSEVTQYTYDAENQLIQVNKTGMTATYRYDGLGRRIEKNVSGVIRRYVYDNEDIVLEYDGSNTLKVTYTHGPGIDEPLVMRTLGAGGGTYFYQTDALSSIIELTNSAGGVAQSYVYDSFGQIVCQSGSLMNQYTYTGRELDSESGLYYYRARYYDANIGRFIQEDPIGFEGDDTNLYAYVQNNPTNFIDPNGLTIVIPLPRPIVLPRPIPILIPRPVPRPVPVIPFPDDKLDKDICTKLFIRCDEEKWGGDWDCFECHFFCTGINGYWPFEHCSPDLACQ